MFAGAVSDVEMQEHYDEFFEVRRTVGKGPARSPSVPGGLTFLVAREVGVTFGSSFILSVS